MTISTLPIDMAPILALPEWQRREMRDALDNSLTEPKVELSEDLKAELDRRIAHADAHPEDFIPWEVVKAQLESRHVVPAAAVR